MSNSPLPLVIPAVNFTNPSHYNSSILDETWRLLENRLKTIDATKESISSARAIYISAICAASKTILFDHAGPADLLEAAARIDKR